MILSDFLSRQEIDESDPHEIIPISFDMKAILNEKYYKIEEGKYLVQTQSQAQEGGIKVPRSTWNKERSRSKFETRMVSEKISKTSRKFQNKEKRARSSRTKKSNCRSSKFRT